MASLWNIPGAKGLFGSKMWGHAASGKSKSFLGAIGRRAIGPGLMLGAFGMVGAARGLLGGAYSMEGPNVAHGYTPGMPEPYTNNPMSFQAANRVTPDMGATGALVFALHNSRKS
jgi:hypothetical protein